MMVSPSSPPHSLQKDDRTGTDTLDDPRALAAKKGDDPTLATTALEVAKTVPADWSEPHSQRRAVPPTLLARYEDIRFVGEGAMGTVYRGKDSRLGRMVALKLLKGVNPELWRRFIGEARAQARIQHEHVCRVYEAGEADGEPYIAMQYIEGEPLSTMADRLTLEQQVKVMREISAAVHEAHRLGMIHRDIKPGNVLVEERDDGTFKPYIMDFGLAREVEDKGQTQTGAILGTPAYMPPEQAKGDVRAMDRRSDVYSLGATLYDLIAGRPPFLLDHPWKLLIAVAYDDAPALGKVKKGVPEDLDTIVMKCLEKEPSRRYDSARALADDLQRFLDGEPIQAKRASIGYFLWKKAQKHKLAASLITVFVMASLVVVGVSMRARQQAAEQARLAQKLGEGVKEMELFLRAAYELPLHDVERERDVVRERLGEIEQRMEAAGKAGEGTGHYALGRGHLALGEPDKARAHLEKALAAGYSSADLEYALGRAFGELFRRAMDETRRLTNEEERKKKIGEIDVALRDPALVHLRAAVAAKIEVPAYAQGLIALYEGKNEAARALAKEAFQRAPWMYEAKRLEGDALYAMGSKYRHDAAFDYEKMKSYFDPAAEAYRIAADMGRSDPEAHRAECELWEKIGQATFTKGLPFNDAYETATAACTRAVQSSHRDGKARVQQALVLSSHLYFIAEAGASEKSIELAENAVRAAKASVEASPGDIMAHYAVAGALYQKARISMKLGGRASMDETIKAYERVLAMDPHFTWALNELGYAYLDQAKNENFHGQDGANSMRSAIRQFDQAMATDPEFILAAGRRLTAYRLLLEAEIDRGRDAADTLRALSNAVVQLEKTHSGPWLVAYWKARAHRFRGYYEKAFGRDPHEHVEAAIREIHTFAEQSPDDYWFLVELAECHLIDAAYMLRQGRSPKAILEARKAIEKAREVRKPTPPELRMLAARVEISSIQWGIEHGEVNGDRFDTAFEELRPLVSETDSDPEAFCLQGQLHALRVAWLTRKGSKAEEDIVTGFTMIEKALSKNPHMARALLVKGQLFLERARLARTQSERVEAAGSAKKAFETAFRENPLLEKPHADEANQVDAFLR